MGEYGGLLNALGNHHSRSGGQEAATISHVIPNPEAVPDG